MMDSLVACKHSPEFRQRRTASSPKEHYNGFCLNKLQCLSDLQNVVGKCCLLAHFQDVHHSHTCPTAKMLMSLWYLSIPSTCFWVVLLAWQLRQFLIFFLYHQYLMHIKHSGLVRLFKMQTEVPVF